MHLEVVVYKNVRYTSPALKESEIPCKVIDVKTDADFLLRTSLDVHGLCVEFRSVESFKQFRGIITVTFPPFCVLAEEKIFLEIIPESLVRAYNTVTEKKNSGNPLIATPILHIDRENDSPFLREVKISLPILPSFASKNLKTTDETSIINGQFHLSESKFSPTGGAFFDGILRALRVDTHFSLTFRELGVYLLVEQFPQKKFLFDLRRFRDEEEHRLFRMDEKKSFRMIVNPERIDDSVVGSSVLITIQSMPIICVCTVFETLH